MTKKHFIEIAAAIKLLKDHGTDQDALLKTVLVLCGTFKRLNPAFDRQRFLDACGF